MVLFVLAYLAGALTIVAPCILPVVPFVFARVDRPFTTSGLPLLAGLALSFACVASLGAVAGAWAVDIADGGRWIAMAVLAATGVALIAPQRAERLARPLVALGSWLTASVQRGDASSGKTRPVATSFVLGVATGLLWAPCAGPVLGLVLTLAVLQGASAHTWLLLLTYAAGAASSLALVLGVGQRVVRVLKRTRGAVDGLRRGLGAAVLAGVAAAAFGLDTGPPAALSGRGNAWEQRLLDRWAPSAMPARTVDTPAAPGGFLRVQAPVAPLLALPAEGAMPSLDGAVAWLNSPPLTAADLRGKVVLVDFWTFGCSNCRNALPHVREWSRKYRDRGLVVVGVHSPEFAYEKNIANVRRALNDLDVPFPVAVDNDFAVWRAFRNTYWPAHYFVDAHGQIRFHHFGEGEYEKSEQVIRQLLDEARKESKS